MMMMMMNCFCGMVDRRLLFAVFSTSSALLCLLFTECTQDSLKSDFNKNCGCLTLPTTTSERCIRRYYIKNIPFPTIIKTIANTIVRLKQKVSIDK